MSLRGNTTEFSAHLSRSRMARYLQGQLSEQERNEVERHLSYCEHCSESMMKLIQQEEPAAAKQHLKKLKGKVKTSASYKKKKLSKTGIKAFRAAAALLLLFVFSFFAIETVIDKNNHHEGREKQQIKQRPSARQIRKSTEELSSANTHQEALAMNHESKPAPEQKKAKKPVNKTEKEPQPVKAKPVSIKKVEDKPAEKSQEEEKPVEKEATPTTSQEVDTPEVKTQPEVIKIEKITAEVPETTSQTESTIETPTVSPILGENK